MRDSSEKPTARYERGLVADSPTRRGTPKGKYFLKGRHRLWLRHSSCYSRLYAHSTLFCEAHFVYLSHSGFQAHWGLFGRVPCPFFGCLLVGQGSWSASLATCVLKQLMLLFYLVVLYLLFELRSQP